MPENIIKLLLSGVVGAAVGAFLTVVLTAWLDWRKEIRNVEIEKEILGIKRQFLDDLKQNIKDAQEAVTLVGTTRTQALQDAERINLRREQAEIIVKELEGKTMVDPNDVAAILRPEIEKKLQASMPRFQMGLAILEGKLERGSSEKIAERPIPIEFPRGVFHESPEVYVSLKRIDLGGKGNIHRIEVEAREITKTGFSLVFKTWYDSKVYTAHAAWLAIGK